MIEIDELYNTNFSYSYPHYCINTPILEALGDGFRNVVYAHVF